MSHSRPRRQTSPQPSEAEEASSDTASDISLEASQVSEDAIMSEIPRFESDEEVHQPGAIVRIRMQNFVTYTTAEFHCGPSLNMIIGPNGTGKSTIVCAICLGLGWHPQILGRAKDVGEFVKNGQREAEIEIELKAGPHHRGRNPVVKRVIRREGNKSTWYINGSSTTRTDVQNLMKYFHIQVDNLCQFLPQDKVVEFARLTPVQLLEQTERAVGTEEMVGWHEELKKLGAERKKASIEINSAQNHLSSLQARQEQQQSEVDQINERKSLKVRLNALEKSRPALKYELAKAKAQSLKDDVEDARRNLSILESEVEPALADVKSKEEYIGEIKAHLEPQKNTAATLEQRVNDWRILIKEKAEAVASKRQEIESAQSAKQRSNKTVMQLTQKLSSLERRHRDGPPTNNLTGLNERKRDAEKSLKFIKNNTIPPIDAELKETFEKLQTAKKRDGEIAKQLADLRTQAGQQRSKLKKVSPNSFQAWDWIQQNKDVFRDEVYGPALVTCSIKDIKYAREVESLLQNQDFYAFTVTNQDDYVKLQKALYGELKLSDIAIRTQTQSLSAKRAAFNNAMLQQYDFERWAIDVLDGPELVLSMLCDAGNLHRTPITIRKLGHSEEEALKDSPIQQYLTGDKICSIKRRREYGPSAVSVMIKPLKPMATYWTGLETAPADAALREESQQLEMDSNTARDELKSLRHKKEMLADKVKKLNDEINNINKEKEEVQKAQAEYATLSTSIENTREKIDAEKNVQREYHDTVAAIQESIDDLMIERSKMATEYVEKITAFQRCVHNQIEAELYYLEAKSELEQLGEAHKDIMEQLKERKKQVADLKQLQATAVDEARKLARELKKDNNVLSQEEQEIRMEFLQRDDRSLDLLETEITSTKTRIGLMSNVNPNVIQDFEKRAEDIERYTEKVNRLRDESQKVVDQIKEIRDKWEPELKRLVGKISEAFEYNFEQIRCAGHVKVDEDEDEDYSQWAIQIQVRFRDHEQLSVLDSHRQSGGERSVSTIFYLMSLQSLAKAPFRVVDEINQGMDPRNERMVHKRMVEIACAENTSQYFLITPKLLPDLTYDPRMVVHIILSGATVPKDDTKVDLKSLADLAMRVRAR